MSDRVNEAAPVTEAGRRIDAAFQAAYDRGDRSASWQDARSWILAIEREATERATAAVDVDYAALASMIVEHPFEASEEWGAWPSLWERLASIHGRPGDSSRREAAAMLRHLAARLSGESEPWNLADSLRLSGESE